MVCVQVAVFPHSSVAVHVRIKNAGHALVINPSVNEMTGDPLQLSVAVAVPVFAGNVLASQSIVILTGHVIEGAVLSNTVIVWVQVAKLPQASVAL